MNIKTSSFKRIASIGPVIVLGLILSGCVTANNQKQFGGTIIGGGLGALAGSQIGSGRGQLVAVGLGTLVGAMIGSEIGRSLDDHDRYLAQQAQQQAIASAPIGQSVAWNNPRSGNYGTYTPTRDGTNTTTGAYCREYQTTIVVGGQTANGYGNACRQPDGSWQVVN